MHTPPLSDPRAVSGRGGDQVAASVKRYPLCYTPSIHISTQSQGSAGSCSEPKGVSGSCYPLGVACQALRSQYLNNDPHAMVYLPTFLSSWSFPSFPPISLPASIQRRFLSYVLKRTLGRYVRAGGLDVDRIQAQISDGWVEIEGLEVDEVVSNTPSSNHFSLFALHWSWTELMFE